MKIGHEQPGIPTCFKRITLLVEDMWMWSKLSCLGPLGCQSGERFHSFSRQDPLQETEGGPSCTDGGPGESRDSWRAARSWWAPRGGRWRAVGHCGGWVSRALCSVSLCHQLSLPGARRHPEQQRTPVCAQKVLVQVDLISFTTLALQ